MGSEQLLLELPIRTAMDAADFVVSASNRDAVAWLDRWPDWPDSVLAIYGPAGCGKTHLAHVWQARSHAGFLDPGRLRQLPAGGPLILDAARPAEEDLFHLVNHARAQKLSLLILDRDPPARWPVTLPDLASRLAGMPAIGVVPPDDPLLAAVLAKHFSDRQILVGRDVIGYLVRHIERSFAAAETAAGALDRAALARGRPITIKLAREILNSDQP
jgi:chromosomal replication initiation ATPase DnaA